MLKKVILAFFISTVLCATTFARETRQEVYAGYGYPQSGTTFTIYNLAGLFSTVASGGNTSISVKSAGGYNLGYNWYPIKWLGVGGTFTGEFFETVSKDPETNVITDSENMFASTIQGKVTFQYGGNLVRGYHGVSAGLYIISGGNTPPSPAFAFNFTLAGLKLGPEGPGFSGYVDLNLGTSQLINAGAIYTF